MLSLDDRLRRLRGRLLEDRRRHVGFASLPGGESIRTKKEEEKKDQQVQPRVRGASHSTYSRTHPKEKVK